MKRITGDRRHIVPRGPSASAERTQERDTMSLKSYSNRMRANFAGCFATAAVMAFTFAAQAQPAGVDTAGIDPAAQRLLKTSLDFLASQNQFSVDTRNSLDVVLYSGQKIQFNHTARQSIQRPN
jgi:hypothetical protein